MTTRKDQQVNPDLDVASPSDPTKVDSVTSESQVTEKDKDALDTEQVVVFKLANEEYAAPILDVQEIITTGDITPFPNVPSYIAGIINIRGTVATIINLAKKF